jgi:hypothetical protein
MSPCPRAKGERVLQLRAPNLAPKAQHCRGALRGFLRADRALGMEKDQGRLDFGRLRRAQSPSLHVCVRNRIHFCTFA